jgi:pimeloyl-ACP methyl ester carboxylesterase
VTKATASPKVDRTIRLRDGRQMAYSEWGDLDGRPVVLLHGRPGSRLVCPDEDATEAAGVRLLTMDRPAYGLSDPRPGRTLLSWVDDFVDLADHLDLSPCPVVGWSGGGPYALASGFRLPDRVTTLGLAAAEGPTDPIPGILETDAISAEYRAAVELFARDRAAGVAAFEKRYAWFSGDGWEAMFAESWGPADDRLLAAPATLEAMKTLIREGARQGSAGWVADAVAQNSAWGFSATEIHQPVRIWCGEADAVDVRMTAEYLAGAIPHATLVMYPDEGHLFPFDHWAEMLAALL